MTTPVQPSAEDNKNRFLRETLKNLAKLQRIVASQEPNSQDPVQGQFDEVVQRVGVVHALLVERGYLSVDDTSPPAR